MIPKPKILSVDDSPANLLSVRKLLSKFDVEIIEATCGNEALAATLDHEFALILLDVSMPDMSGFEVARLLSIDEAGREIPIIFVSATYADEIHRLQGYHTGAVDYMTKPLDERVLRSKVQVFLDLYKRGVMLRRALAQLAERNEQLEREIAERRQSEAEVRHLAAHDALTGLPNRRHLLEVLDSAISTAIATQSSCGLIYFDLDRFKAVNDEYGHLVGDQVLMRIADQLRATCLPGEVAARLGGDEFAIVIEDAKSLEAVSVRSQEISKSLSSTIRVTVNAGDRTQSLEFDIEASFGVALCPEHGDNSDSLIRAVDEAMYSAKRASRENLARRG
jgi:diguanylate cyclase (GGDEF)-like protein